jgi:hypothetical protein
MLWLEALKSIRASRGAGGDVGVQVGVGGIDVGGMGVHVGVQVGGMGVGVAVAVVVCVAVGGVVAAVDVWGADDVGFALVDVGIAVGTGVWVTAAMLTSVRDGVAVMWTMRTWLAWIVASCSTRYVISCSICRICLRISWLRTERIRITMSRPLKKISKNIKRLLLSMRSLSCKLASQPMVCEGGELRIASSLRSQAGRVARACRYSLRLVNA